MNHHSFFNPREIEGFLRGLDHNYNKKLDTIIKRIKHMSQEVDNLTAQVKANSEAIDSAVVLINGIADRIQAAGVDPAKLTALTDELRTKDQALSEAVVANTEKA